MWAAQVEQEMKTPLFLYQSCYVFLCQQFTYLCITLCVVHVLSALVVCTIVLCDCVCVYMYVCLHNSMCVDCVQHIATGFGAIISFSL